MFIVFTVLRVWVISSQSTNRRTDESCKNLETVTLQEDLSESCIVFEIKAPPKTSFDCCRNGMTVTQTLLFSTNCSNTFVTKATFAFLTKSFLQNNLYEAIVPPTTTFNFFLHSGILQMGYILMFPSQIVGQHKSLDCRFSRTTSKGSISIISVKCWVDSLLPLKNLNFMFVDHPQFGEMIFPKQKCHCVKSVRIWNYFGPYFPAFGLNTGQNNSEYEHILRNG